MVRDPDVGLQDQGVAHGCRRLPTILLVVVLGTGNHFVLDVVAGAACVVVAYGIVTLIGRAMGKTSKQHDPRRQANAQTDAELVNAA